MNGYVIVATHRKSYLTAAQMLAESIHEHYPEGQITLFTEDDWIEDKGNDAFDHIYGGMPPSIRSKLLACSLVEDYDKVCYIDADCICHHPDIKNVFDLTDQSDIVFTHVREYNAKCWWWNPETTKHPHGGWFVWRNSPKMQSFFKEWWDNWREIYENNLWRWIQYDQRDCKGWDQFPLCLMLDVNKDNDAWHRPDVRWHLIESARWNYIDGYKYWKEHIEDDDIVIQSYHTDKFKSHMDHENPR